jgi:hypothetical protein
MRSDYAAISVPRHSSSTTQMALRRSTQTRTALEPRESSSSQLAQRGIIVGAGRARGTAPKWNHSTSPDPTRCVTHTATRPTPAPSRGRSVSRTPRARRASPSPIGVTPVRCSADGAEPRVASGPEFADRGEPGEGTTQRADDVLLLEQPPRFPSTSSPRSRSGCASGDKVPG